MTNKEKFIEIFGEELPARKYGTKDWWDQEYEQPTLDVKLVAKGVTREEWIPLKTRPMTDEESTFYRDWAEYGAEIFDCPLPDDGQEVLVSWGGNVFIDTFVKDDSDGCYFEGIDIDDVEAWMPLPPCYDSQESEVRNADSN